MESDSSVNRQRLIQSVKTLEKDISRLRILTEDFKEVWFPLNSANNTPGKLIDFDSFLFMVADYTTEEPLPEIRPNIVTQQIGEIQCEIRVKPPEPLYLFRSQDRELDRCVSYYARLIFYRPLFIISAQNAYKDTGKLTTEMQSIFVVPRHRSVTGEVKSALRIKRTEAHCLISEILSLMNKYLFLFPSCRNF